MVFGPGTGYPAITPSGSRLVLEHHHYTPAPPSPPLRPAHGSLTDSETSRSPTLPLPPENSSLMVGSETVEDGYVQQQVAQRQSPNRLVGLSRPAAVLPPIRQRPGAAMRDNPLALEPAMSASPGQSPTVAGNPTGPMPRNSKPRFTSPGYTGMQLGGGGAGAAFAAKAFSGSNRERVVTDPGDGRDHAAAATGHASMLSEPQPSLNLLPRHMAELSNQSSIGPLFFNDGAQLVHAQLGDNAPSHSRTVSADGQRQQTVAFGAPSFQGMADGGRNQLAQQAVAKALPTTDEPANYAEATIQIRPSQNGQGPVIPPPAPVKCGDAIFTPSSAFGVFEDTIHSVVWQVARAFGFQVFNSKAATAALKMEDEYGRQRPQPKFEFVPATAFVAGDHLCRLIVQNGMKRPGAGGGEVLDDGVGGGAADAATARQRFARAVYELHSSIFYTFEKKYCRRVRLPERLAAATQLMVAKEYNHLDVMHGLLAELSLYFLLYSEAANLRHTPEALWFFYWTMATSPQMAALWAAGAGTAAIAGRGRDRRVLIRNAMQEDIAGLQHVATKAVNVTADLDAAMTAALATGLSQGDAELLLELATYGDGGHVCDRLITPLFYFLSHEMDKMHETGRDNAHRLGYDDVNESLCDHHIVHNTLKLLTVSREALKSAAPNTAWEAIQRLGYATVGPVAKASKNAPPIAPVIKTFDPQVAANFWSSQVFVKTFRERRSWLAVWRAYFRVFALQLILINIMMAQAFEPYDLKPLSSAVVSHAWLVFLERFANWWLTRNPRDPMDQHEKKVAWMARGDWRPLRTLWRNTTNFTNPDAARAHAARQAALEAGGVKAEKVVVEGTPMGARKLRNSVVMEGAPFLGIFGFIEYLLLAIFLTWAYVLYWTDVKPIRGWEIAGRSLHDLCSDYWLYAAAAYSGLYVLHFILTLRPGYCVSLTSMLHLPRLFTCHSSRPSAQRWMDGSLSMDFGSFLLNVLMWVGIFGMKLSFEYFLIFRPLTGPLRALTQRNWFGCGTEVLRRIFKTDKIPCISGDWILMVLRVLPFILVCLVDTQVIYNIMVALMGLAHGILQMELGKPASWPAMVASFHKGPALWWKKGMSKVGNERHRRQLMQNMREAAYAEWAPQAVPGHQGGIAALRGSLGSTAAAAAAAGVRTRVNETPAMSRLAERLPPASSAWGGAAPAVRNISVTAGTAAANSRSSPASVAPAQLADGLKSSEVQMVPRTPVNQQWLSASLVAAVKRLGDDEHVEKWSAFSVVWDAIIDDLRSTDLVNNEEAENLRFMQLGAAGARYGLRPLLLPTFFYAGRLRRTVDTNRVQGADVVVLTELRALLVWLGCELQVLNSTQANVVLQAIFCRGIVDVDHSTSRMKMYESAIKLLNALQALCRVGASRSRAAHPHSPAATPPGTPPGSPRSGSPPLGVWPTTPPPRISTSGLPHSSSAPDMAAMDRMSFAAAPPSKNDKATVDKSIGEAKAALGALLGCMRVECAAVHKAGWREGLKGAGLLADKLSEVLFEVEVEMKRDGAFGLWMAPLHSDHSEGANVQAFNIRTKVIKAAYKMLTVSSSTATPNGSEARRILSFFMNSLSNPQLNKPPAVMEMLSMTTVTPCYEEDVLYALEARSVAANMGLAKSSGLTDLLSESEDRVSLMAYLRSVYSKDFANFLERLGGQLGRDVSRASELDFAPGGPLAAEALQLQLWATLRGQLLGRTVNGMMCYERAVRHLAMLEYPRPPDLSEEAYITWVEKLVAAKYDYVVTCQVYSACARSTEPHKRWLAQSTDVLLQHYNGLKVAFLDMVNEKDGPTQYSVLIRGSGEHDYAGAVGEHAPATPLTRELYRVRLPANRYTNKGVVIGEGKPENQNHAIIFAFGEGVQTVDMNQDNRLAEAFKMRNLLTELSPAPATTWWGGRKAEKPGPGWKSAQYKQAIYDRVGGERAVAAVGFREWVFSEVAGALGKFSAASEFAFGTILQRSMANVGHVRFHYGHPDVFNKVNIMTKGGVSKASRQLHISEDVLGGFAHVLRGSQFRYRDYISVGKGRDMGFASINGFEAKISGGGGEAVTTREVHRLSTRLDIFRLLHFYHSGLGYFINSVILTQLVHLSMLSLVVFGLARATTVQVVSESGGVRSYTIEDTLKIQPVVQLGPVSVLPYIAQLLLEYGFLKTSATIFMQLLAGSLAFFVFRQQSTSAAFAEDLAYGSATYISTGRGFNITAADFVTVYKNFARSHMYYGFDLAQMLIAYAVVIDCSACSYAGTTWGTWLVVVALLVSPWWFNPLTFSNSKIKRDFKAWKAWMRGEMDGTTGSNWFVWNKQQLAKVRNERGNQTDHALGVLSRVIFDCTGPFLLAVAAVSRLEVKTFIGPESIRWLNTQFVVFVIATAAFWIVALAAYLFRRFARSAGNTQLLRLTRLLFAALGLAAVAAYFVLAIKWFGGNGFGNLIILLYANINLLLVLHRFCTHVLTKNQTGRMLVDLGFWIIDLIIGGTMLLVLAILSFIEIVARLQASLLFNATFARSVRRGKLVKTIGLQKADPIPPVVAAEPSSGAVAPAGGPLDGPRLGSNNPSMHGGAAAMPRTSRAGGRRAWGEGQV